MKSKTITLCASASFYKNVNQIKKDLRNLGFVVLVPHTALVMEKNNDYVVAHYKTWFASGDYSKKRMLMDGHIKEIVKGDSILVINNTKRGIRGYIGGNVLIEMAIAYYLKKKIFILNTVSKKLPIYEEVFGLSPIVLNGDVTKISKHI